VKNGAVTYLCRWQASEKASSNGIEEDVTLDYHSMELAAACLGDW